MSAHRACYRLTSASTAAYTDNQRRLPPDMAPGLSRVFYDRPRDLRERPQGEPARPRYDCGTGVGRQTGHLIANHATVFWVLGGRDLVFVCIVVSLGWFRCQSLERGSASPRSNAVRGKSRTKPLVSW